MTFARIIRILSHRRRALAIVVGLSVLAALFSLFSISFAPPGLKSRSVEYGAAQSQILVDSGNSALVDSTKDTGAVASRALIFAQFMDSISFRQELASVTGAPADEIRTQGPFTDIGIRRNVTSATGPRGTPVQEDRYQLVFDAQEDLPVITVYAQAPTTSAAEELADGSLTALKNLSTKLKDQSSAPFSDEVIIRGLGPAEGGTVNGGAGIKIAFMIGVAVLLFGCAAIVWWPSLVRIVREPDEVLESGRYAYGSALKEAASDSEAWKERAAARRLARRRIRSGR